MSSIFSRFATTIGLWPRSRMWNPTWNMFAFERINLLPFPHKLKSTCIPLLIELGARVRKKSLLQRGLLASSGEASFAHASVKRYRPVFPSLNIMDNCLIGFAYAESWSCFLHAFVRIKISKSQTWKNSESLLEPHSLRPLSGWAPEPSSFLKWDIGICYTALCVNWYEVDIDSTPQDIM